MTSSKLEAVLLVVRSDDVNDSRSVLLLVETLQDKEVALRSFVVHQIVGLPKRSNHQRVCLLADFALKRLPIVGGKVDALLHLLLDVQPASQTVEVDEPH